MIVVNETGDSVGGSGNSYFTKPPALSPVTKARSVDINKLADAVDAAFDKIPDQLEVKKGTVNFAVDVGTVENAYAVTMNAAIVSYTDGFMVRMRPTRANTGACSINVNGLGAIAIKRDNGTDMLAGDIGIDMPVSLTYVAASNTFVSGVVVKSQVAQVAAQSAAAVSSATTAAGAASAATEAAALAVARSSMAATVGLRNVIINGCMRVAQRPAVAGQAGYTNIDRWFLNSAGATVSMSQATVAGIAGPGYATVMRVSGAVGNTDSNVLQRIESVNCRHMAGQFVTVAYWYYQDSGVTKNIVTSFAYPNSADNFGTLTPGASSTTAIPNATWTKVKFTTQLSVLAANGISLGLGEGFGAVGAGKIYQIGDVQLELGLIDTPIERRPIGIEMALCQRYFQRLNYVRPSFVTYAANGDTRGWLPYIAPMRVTPSLTFATTQLNLVGVGDVSAVINVAVQIIAGVCEAHGFGISVTPASSQAQLAPAGAVVAWATSDSLSLTASAEI